MHNGILRFFLGLYIFSGTLPHAIELCLLTSKCIVALLQYEQQAFYRSFQRVSYQHGSWILKHLTRLLKRTLSQQISNSILLNGKKVCLMG